MSEPAFPTNYFYDQESGHEVLPMPGMTLRDYFAAKAMQGILAANTETINALLKATKSSGSVSELAYVMADAMLKARKE